MLGFCPAGNGETTERFRLRVPVQLCGRKVIPAVVWDRPGQQ